MRLLLTLFFALILSACGGGGGGGGGTASTPAVGASNVFVRDFNSNAIGSVVNRNPGAGTLTIDRILSGTSTQIGANQGEMFMDSLNDRLYVANGTSILAYNNAGSLNGNVAPSRVVTNSGSQYSSVFLDRTNNRLYATDSSNGIRIFDNASTANLVSPTRQVTVSGFSPFLYTIAVDTGRNIAYVFASQSGSPSFYVVYVFDGAATMNGFTAPSRTMSLSATASYGGLALDATNNRLYVGDAGGVSVYDNVSTANGSVLPAKRFVFPVGNIYRVAFDAANDRLYATRGSLIYVINNASTASGAVAATQISISGANLSSIAVR